MRIDKVRLGIGCSCGHVSAGAALSLLLLAVGCQQPHDWWQYRVVTGVQVSLPPVTGQERMHPSRQGRQGPLMVQPGGSQTLLLASRVHDDPDAFGDEWDRTFVVVLDGPPSPGKHAVTPDNGRLIVSRAGVPPRVPYVGLDGSIQILSIDKKGKVLAACSLVNTSTRHGDRGRWLQGWRTFDPAAAGEILYGVRFAGQAAGKDESP